jgi:hypothetical protein
MNETTKTLASQATAELPKSTACLWVTDNPKHCSLLRPAPNVVNAFPWPADSKTAEDAAYWRERGFWQEPLYTADQMNAHYLDGVEAGRAAAFAAVPPIDAVPGEPVVLDELRATICGVGIVGQINGDDVIRRESVIDLIDRRRLAASVASRAGSEPVAPFGWYGEAKFENGFTTDARVREMWEANGRRITPLHAIAPAAAAEPSESPWFGVEDEVSLTRAVSVMNDVLTDISGWEDRALAEAIESSKVDLCAMIECIRMRADDSYVPGSKPIDGEAVPIIPDRERAASLVASEDTKRLDFLQAWADKSIAQGFKWDNYVFTNDVPIREQLDTARASAGEAQS